MADTVTTTLGLTKPEVGASEDSWGEKINTNFDLVDDALDGTTAVSLDINGGTIDGAVIGGATPAAGTFTTLTANTSIGGTLSTAAQPNVTSVGTLTGLTVSGSTSLAGASTSADITFGDNDKAIFGAGSDLQIYHDGNDSIIKESGAGHLRLLGDDIKIRDVNNAEMYIDAVKNGTVGLYYDNSAKLNTTSTGIDVTGEITADGLTVDGDINAITDAVVDIYMMENDTTDLNTLLRSNAGDFSIRTSNDAKNVLTQRLNIDHATGDISFYEDTGTTPKFFWDASAESLGIGTSSPTDKLNISSGSNQIGLDTGNQATYGTLDIGHFTNGAFIGTQAGSNAASNLLRFGTSGTERIRIDSSGNLLVGRTSNTFSGTGHIVQPNGIVYHMVDGAAVQYLRRNTSDGDILRFHKDTTQVGSIGYESSGLYIDGEDGHAGLSFGGNSVVPRDGGARLDNVVDVGSATYRFKDLYLSGGVYLGGTGSANKLDDYETGTWTPSIGGASVNPTVTYTLQNGFYTKVGRMVYIEGRIDISAYSGGSGLIELDGLPFTSIDPSFSVLSISRISTWSADYTGRIGPSWIVLNGDTRCFMYSSDNTAGGVDTFSTAVLQAGSSLTFSGCYETS